MTTKYIVGLMMGGLMEDLTFHLEYIKEIEAETEREAKQKWAEITHHVERKDWDPVRQSYWGWEVKVYTIT